MVVRIREAENNSAYAIAEIFFGLWLTHLRNFHLEAGCSVVAVSQAGEERLRAKAAAIFTAWQAALARALQKAGLEQGLAEAYALISSCEGAVVLCPSSKSLAPLKQRREYSSPSLPFLLAIKKELRRPLSLNYLQRSYFITCGF